MDSISLSNAEFISAMFPQVPDGAHLWGHSWVGCPCPDCKDRRRWKGKALREPTRWEANAGNYICIGAYDGDRRKANCVAVYALFLDDVGEKGAYASIDELPLPPTYAVETSPGSFQVVYAHGACTDLKLWDVVQKALAGKADPGSSSATRYFRLPEGTNHKCKLSAPFRHRVAVWAPERVYSVSEVAAAFGVDTEVREAPKSNGSAVPKTELDEALLSIRYTDELKYHETSGRDLWLQLGMGYREGGGDFDTFHAWCAEQDGYVGEDQLRAEWDSFEGEGITAATVFGVASHQEKVEEKVEELRALVAGEPGARAGKEPKRTKVPSRSELAATAAEAANAELTPPCIVQNLLYADLAVLNSVSGVGKTTLMLHIQACIALQRPVLGLPVERPGWLLFVSAEDQRERLLARHRAVLDGMELTPEDRVTALERFSVWDVTGEDVRLARMRDGNAEPTDLAEDIIEAYRDDPPALVVFDPLVSFAASERAINDSEQAVITAARRIIRGLGCGVLLVHHIGQDAGRAKADDQFVGRGGSALPAGARTVLNLHSWTKDDKGKPPQTLVAENFLGDGHYLRLTRTKLTYAPPKQPDLWVLRREFRFSYALDEQLTDEAKAEREMESDDAKVETFLRKKLHSGETFSKNGAAEQNPAMGLSRARVRSAINRMLDAGRLELRDVPFEERSRGSKVSYLHPKDGPLA